MADNLDELIERTKCRLEGSGDEMVCCHPDVTDTPLEHPDRKCVLDDDRPDDCDIAKAEQYSDKIECPFWQSTKRIQPAPLSIEQAVELLDALTALKAERDALRMAIKWVNEVHPAKTRDGSARVEMMFEEFAAMKAALQQKDRDDG